mmetsp:Transcript_751/g.1199  ORF Transcript_751/g.1199 Transcript_751/m.1199 type:complete len:98 (+) Transcript_751:291-584(+)|eukprot:CAMPEP_0184299674 /NCGR_PEP_ID=MMETSP1049-20130417/10238_1 /TAXON_ID=77928 /ORGANISM="Proteomonas sulcata, Strain CCMP704" /LENGTH=97 /DNA_ID=CAMNT_0026610175 /DNA_START=294 /DNA_END=587 /DNA_ORIENTATION=+
MTICDLRLFVTLIRFDVYYVYFKCNKKRADEFPNLFEFMKEMYQVPEIQATVNLKQLTESYYSCHPHLNCYAIVPKGRVSDLTAPHNRGKHTASSSG